MRSPSFRHAERPSVTAAHGDLPGRAHSGRRKQRVENCGSASGYARLAALPSA
jgi:hypothetical protein